MKLLSRKLVVNVFAIKQTRVETLPHISNIMCLPGQSNSVGTDHVHNTCLSQKVLSCFKSRVALSQNKYCLIPIVISISGHGLITFNKVRTNEVDLIRNPKPCGNQEDPKQREEQREHGVLQILDKHDFFSPENTCTCIQMHADQSVCSSSQSVNEQS